eukprot:CAMPEP_0168592590 /NCGR_PEP_ID=MMETSP0420-20121227/7823_1 /TAXON_ID=498008 /ORGANISM="Pessonella sp." /LENGTH=300 /DNA_ID=CAMNT_0008628607 /DNA_START=23 /DNA_END=922 /DNA_ORIENTATION=+
MSETSANNGLFEDVFRRADKNDDGKLDVPEFHEFFGDNYTTEEDLTTFFKSVDTDQNGGIDHSELINFFSSGEIGKNYSQIFSTLETLHSQLNKALVASHSLHAKEKNPQELFKERFFLRELSHQLETLQQTSESGFRGVAAMTPLVLSDKDRFEIDMPAPAVADMNGPLGQQVSKLEKLIQRLEKGKPQFNVPEEEIFVSTDSTDAFLVVAHQFETKELTKAAGAARSYVALANKQSGVRHVAVRVVEGEKDAPSQLFIHEIWAEPDERAEFAADDNAKKLFAAIGKGDTKQINLPSTW